MSILFSCLVAILCEMTCRVPLELQPSPVLQSVGDDAGECFCSCASVQIFFLFTIVVNVFIANFWKQSGKIAGIKRLQFTPKIWPITSKAQCNLIKICLNYLMFLSRISVICCWSAGQLPQLKTWTAQPSMHIQRLSRWPFAYPWGWLLRDPHWCKALILLSSRLERDTFTPASSQLDCSIICTTRWVQIHK